MVYPEFESHAGSNVMIGHLVSCYGSADRYLGMLSAVLGEWDRAEEHFERPPAMVWRYKNTTCELDLFFYLDLRSNRMRSLHYAVKGNDVDPAKRQDCVTSLRVAQSK